MRKILEGLRTVDPHSAIALLYTGVNLTIVEFWFLSPTVQQRINQRDGTHRASSSLEAGVTWAAATIFLQMIVPILLIKLVHRRKLSEHGWQLRGFLTHVWVYLGLFAFMAPFVWFASKQPAFLSRYPFVAEARHDFSVWLQWEAVYLVQFFALESFFRGYLVFTLERALRWNAIFVMAVPYCMIHFHKPALECFGALIAGVALGTLALRFRSWYGGAVLHCLVAVSMDLLAFRAGN